jgi:branched-chain amino acid transport system substrate-binding protein
LSEEAIFQVKLIIFALKVVLISCILLSCTSEKESSDKESKGSIFIALAAPLSGPLSEFGWSMVRGARMRIGNGKDETVCTGRSVKLMVLDDKGDATQALRLAKNISGYQSIVAVIGHLTTGCTLAAIPVYNSAGLIQISPVATGDDLKRIKSPYTFRTILSESEQAMSLADYVYRTIDVKKVIVVCEGSSLGDLLKNSFLLRSREIGLSVETIPVQGNSLPDLTETIDKILTMKPGGIFLAGGPELAALIVRELPEKVRSPLVFGTYRIISEEFLELAGKHSTKILAAHPCVWRSDFIKGRDMKMRYERKFKHTMDWVAVQAYDTVGLLLWAIERAGRNAHSIRRVLQDLNSSSNALPGLAGPVWFNSNGSLARGVAVAGYTGSGWKLREELVAQ